MCPTISSTPARAPALKETTLEDMPTDDSLRRRPEVVVSRPLDALQESLDACAANPEALRMGTPVSLGSEVQAALALPGAREAIPSLNAARPEQIPAGSLVRFFGMVQDVQDPEFYIGVYDEARASTRVWVWGGGSTTGS